MADLSVLTFGSLVAARFLATDFPVSAEFGGDKAFFGGLFDFAFISVFGCCLGVGVWRLCRSLLDSRALDLLLA